VRKAAREQLKAGADWIKLMATGGVLPPNERAGDEQMTVEELRAGVEEAHKKGRFALAHISGAQGARNCIAAGVDSFTHGLFLEEDVVRDMKAQGVFLVPTLSAYTRLLELGKKREMPEYVYQKAQLAVASHKRSFQMALAAGVKIAAGTDSGHSHYPIGESIFSELEIMNEYGMAPMDVLMSATSRAAELLRLTDDLGTLEAGKLADILIVEGDPVAKTSEIRKTWMVFKEGRVVFKQGAGS
jgi:imidazolonepropionase-like amidohydrolase